MLLEDAVRHHLDALTADGRSPHTVRNARCVLTELTRFLSSAGIRQIEQLSYEVLMQFRRVLSTRATAAGGVLAPGSQREHIGKLRTFCRWLFEQNWLASDLAKRLAAPRKVKQLPKPIMNLEEVGRILRRPALDTPGGCRDRVILEVLYSTAIRREEAATLVLDDVDTGDGYLTVRHGKNGKDRVVPLGSSACSLLSGYLADVRPFWPGAREFQHLFLTRFGRPMHPAAIWHVVKKHARRAGLKKSVSTHTFRHTCATQMVRAGVPIRHLQELLGHESLETTQIYTRIAIADLKAAHKRFHPRDLDPVFKDLPTPAQCTSIWRRPK